MKKSSLNLQEILSPISSDLNEFEKNISNLFNPENAIIEQIGHYIIKTGGKRLRPALVFLFAKMTGEVTPKHHSLARAVELIHSATLVHDDIIDDADKRRNAPSIHTKWDTKSAVLVGDFLLAKALEFLVATKKEAVLSLFAQTTQEICKGEIEQFSNKKNLSVDEYIERAKRKTGMLFALCAQGSCLISDNEKSDKAKDFAINIGIAFQIIDDLLIFKDGYIEKTAEADFKNATMTLPVVFALHCDKKINFDGDFEAFKNKIKNTNAIDKSYELALKYTNRAMANLTSFEDNRPRKSLEQLASYIVEREF